MQHLRQRWAAAVTQASLRFEHQPGLVKAFDGNRYVGELVYGASAWDDDPFDWYVSSVVVPTEMRRRGIADALLVEAHRLKGGIWTVSGFVSAAGARFGLAMARKHSWVVWAPTSFDAETYPWLPKSAAKTALMAGIPVVDLKITEGHSTTGRVADGATVLAYRGIGSWGELRNAISQGYWKANGGFNVKGMEGDTQVARDINDVLKGARFHQLRGTGFLAVVEFDIRGLAFQTMLTGYNPAKPPWIENQGNGRGGLVVSPADPTRGVIYPDLGLGLGIRGIGGIPLDRIRRVYEVEGRQVKRSWSFSEWESNVDSLSDNPDWSGHRKLIVLVPKSKTTKLHIADRRTQTQPVCGAKPSRETYTALVDPNDAFLRPEQMRDFWRGEGTTFSVREDRVCRDCFGTWPYRQGYDR